MIEFALALALPLILASSPAHAVCPAVNSYPFTPGCPLPADELNKALSGSGGMVNPVDYDPLCGGQTTAAEIAFTPPTAHDCTDAINLAASILVNGRRAKVRLQTGLYYITDSVLLDGSQMMEGDGKASSLLRVRDTFNPAATGVVVFGNTDQFFSAGETISDMGIIFDQPDTPTGGRAGAALLGVCDSRPTGTICKYPPAVMMGTASGSAGRSTFRDIRIQKAWDGIAGTAVGTVNSPNGNGNGVYKILNLEMSALNKGLWVDGVQDDSVVSGFHFWNFGINSATTLYDVMTDGDTDCMNLGAAGALMTNVFCHRSAIRLVASTTDPGNGMIGSMSNVHLDGGSFIVEDNKNFEIANLRVSGGSGLSYPCNLDVRGGQTNIANFSISAPKIGTVPICVSGGAVGVTGGRIVGLATEESVTVSGGALRLRGMDFGVPTTNRAMGVIAQTAGSLTMQNNNVSGPGAATGVFFHTTNDSVNNWFSGNKFGGWPISLDCGAATGGNCLTTIDGFYDLPDMAFTIPTITPSFATPGDFVPANVSQTGRYWLRGDFAEYVFSFSFDTNAYTTAAGGFGLTTDMPTPLTGASGFSGCSFGIHDKLTIASGTKITCRVTGAAPSVVFIMDGTASTAAHAIMGVANIPASRTDYLLSMFGRYQIR